MVVYQHGTSARDRSLAETIGDTFLRTETKGR